MVRDRYIEKTGDSKHAAPVDYRKRTHGHEPEQDLLHPEQTPRTREHELGNDKKRQ